MLYNGRMLNQLLETPILSRIRRNHGLEHATLHVLARRFPNLPMAGHSTASGFRLLGDLPSDAVQEAVDEALRRMRAGEHHLAVHPNCGTNFATAGVLAGLSAGVAMLGAGARRRDQLERLPMAAVFATLSLIVGLPLGLRLQERVTTSGHPGELQVVEIQRSKMRLGLFGGQSAGATVHFVRTRG